MNEQLPISQNEQAPTAPPRQISEDLRPQKSINLPIPGESIATVDATPLMTNELPTIDSSNIPIETDETKATILIQDPQGLPRRNPSYMLRISESGATPHNRSMNWVDKETQEARIVVEGKEYSGFSTKGVALYLGKVVSAPQERDGFRMQGGVTERNGIKVARISQWLWGHGIITERVLGLQRLNQFPEIPHERALYTEDGRLIEQEASTRSELIPEAKWKQELLERAISLNYNLLNLTRIGRLGGPTNIGQLRTYLGENHFVVIKRATTTPFRLSDLTLPLKGVQRGRLHAPYAFNEFAEMMNYMINYLNRNHLVDHTLATIPLQREDGMQKEWQSPEVQANVLDFFAYSATNLGTQVGKLHQAGAVHHMLHRGNITGDGTFVDLDSISGEPLGDAPITNVDITNDLATAFWGLTRTMDVLSKTGLVTKQARTTIAINFLTSYIHNRGITEKSLDDFEQSLIEISQRQGSSLDILKRFRETHWFNKFVREPLLEKLHQEAL